MRGATDATAPPNASQLLAQTRALRAELAALARKPEWDLLKRYDLLRDKPVDWGKRQTRRAQSALSALGLTAPPVTQYEWLPALRHGAVLTSDSRTLLIWAFGLEIPALRQACEAFSALLAQRPGLVPVLVCDRADFAWFSRLGWLVEYLGPPAPHAPVWLERKKRHLAWCYRDALAVPAQAGLLSPPPWDLLLKEK